MSLANHFHFGSFLQVHHGSTPPRRPISIAEGKDERVGAVGPVDGVGVSGFHGRSARHTVGWVNLRRVWGRSYDGGEYSFVGLGILYQVQWVGDGGVDAER